MIQVLSEQESREFEARVWNEMVPGKLLRWQDNRCHEMPPAIIVEKGEGSVRLIVLNPHNVSRIMLGRPCETTTVMRADAFFSEVREPVNFEVYPSLRMPSVVWDE